MAGDPLALHAVAAFPGGIAFPRGEPETDIVWRTLIEEGARNQPSSDDWRSAPSSNLEIELPSGVITYPSMSLAGEIIVLIAGIWTNSSGAAPTIAFRLKLGALGDMLGAATTAYTYTTPGLTSVAASLPGLFRYEFRLTPRHDSTGGWSQTAYSKLLIKSEGSAGTTLISNEDLQPLALDFSQDRRFCFSVQKSTATANQDLIPRSICAAQFIPRTGS
jgi:hypothetical protein